MSPQNEGDLHVLVQHLFEQFGEVMTSLPRLLHKITNSNLMSCLFFPKILPSKMTILDQRLLF